MLNSYGSICTLVIKTKTELRMCDWIPFLIFLLIGRKKKKTKTSPHLISFLYVRNDFFYLLSLVIDSLAYSTNP